MRAQLTGWLERPGIPVLVVRGFGSQSYVQVVRERTARDERPAVLLYIDVYTPAEAVAFLEERLTGDGAGHLLDGRQGELAAALGHLPLTLGHAAAYLMAEELTCTAYLARLADQTLRLDDVLPDWADTERYQRQITAGLLLSLTAAEQTGPPGLVEPLLRLIALLDPDGHPESLWTATAATGYLNSTRQHTTAQDTTTGEVLRALQVLRRYGLITSDPNTPHRQLRMHALTARAARETTPHGQQAVLAVTAADALTETWGSDGHVHHDLAQALRANTTVLRHHCEEHLWREGLHRVVFRTGRDLLHSGLYRDAHAYWLPLAEKAAQALGRDHPDTIMLRANLAIAYSSLGRYEDALALEEQVRTDFEQILGPDHPDTLSARANLAISYWDLGRYEDALALEEQVRTDRERILGPDHPDTLSARANLAITYSRLERNQEALELQEKVRTDRERVLGPDHPDTLSAHTDLAATYGRLGRHPDADRLRGQEGERV
ncbi:MULTISPECIES: tetratricopeptide repeat protein [unclassified Streptomyces]|uniref:tetratricopeptide repeat protein n=1 Tax=unclassified Streptomyces TaxID=2593676 RepID=UPI003448FAAC